jgi:phenylalanyl-tRNA synthetase beta chain
VAADGRTIGRAALLDADAPPWAAPVLGFEVELDATPRRPTRYRPLPSTPSSERDLALLLPGGVTAEQVGRVVEQAAGPLLAGQAILDEYRGGGMDPGVRSVMFRLTFRAPDRTLRDAEVDESERRVLAALERELGVRRREAGPQGSQGE